MSQEPCSYVGISATIPIAQACACTELHVDCSHRGQENAREFLMLANGRRGILNERRTCCVMEILIVADARVLVLVVAVLVATVVLVVICCCCGNDGGEGGRSDIMTIRMNFMKITIYLFITIYHQQQHHIHHHHHHHHHRRR